MALHRGRRIVIVYIYTYCLFYTQGVEYYSTPGGAATPACRILSPLLLRRVEFLAHATGNYYPPVVINAITIHTSRNTPSSILRYSKELILRSAASLLYVSKLLL